MWKGKHNNISNSIFCICVYALGFGSSIYAQTCHFQSLAIHLGMNVVSTNDLSIVQLKSIFPQVSPLQIDFTGFHQNSAVNHLPTIPFRIELEFPFIKNDSSKRIFRNSEFRLKFGYFRHELSYENHLQEHFQAVDPLNFDTIRRNYYAFWWNSNNFNIGIDWIFSTKFLGKQKRSRFLAGTAFLTGFSMGNLFSYHLDGKYIGSAVSNGNSSYVYTFPTIEENVTTTRYSAPFYVTLNPEIPFGYEIALGKKRSFLLGIQIRNGYIWMLNSNQQTISGSTIGFICTLRFLQ